MWPIFLLPSCSGLIRASVAARQVARIDAEGACNDPLVEPEDDDGGKFH